MTTLGTVAYRPCHSPVFESATISHCEPPGSGCSRICDQEGEIDAKTQRQDSLNHRRR
jgi:hypothetical protein